MTSKSILFWLVALVAVGIVFIGARFLVAPHAAAIGFGVAADATPVTYLWAKGTRDIVSGLLLIALLWMRASRRIVGVFMAVATLIPFGDFLNVYATLGTRNPTALAIHSGTAVAMSVLAAALIRSHRANGET